MLGKNRPSSENILILGLGGVGAYLAKRLAHEGYAVTAIEPDSRLIRHTDSQLDARLIQGSAMSIGCWREANVENIDVLIAVGVTRIESNERVIVFCKSMHREDVHKLFLG